MFFHTGPADAANQQVQSRTLAQIIMRQQQTIPTTGRGYQATQAAQGWIVLYNTLNAPQTIQAGTRLTGQDGVQVTTETTVTIPAGSFTRNRQVRVSAHTLTNGLRAIFQRVIWRVPAVVLMYWPTIPRLLRVACSPISIEL